MSFDRTPEARVIRRLLRCGKANEALAFAGSTILAADPAIEPGVLAVNGLNVPGDLYRIALRRLAERVGLPR